ncbi:MAG TPA: dihydrodipicolinate synthase family protein [Pyrinomonadaceae bacterium]|jgi:4-hydroxy-tetrahydrodipicolinate synthase|nr:dihydrodipicolinate synthase family protein [Pyrinomonadaceae bacterium]
MDSEATQRLRARLDGGLVAAVPVPFDREGRLDDGAHESYTRYMAAQPVAGVAVWAHTGRGLMLDEATADRVLAGWRAALPHGVVVAGAGSRRADDPARANADSVAMAERAARLGADALLAYAPVWLRGRERRGESIVEHHRRLASVGLPLILFYLYEEAGGVSYEPSVLDELLSMPEVVGVKMATLDSVMTYQDVSRRLAARHPEKLLITGEDRFLGYSLMRGARSALIGMGAVCCGLQADLIRAHAEADAARFLRLSSEVDALAESLFVRPLEGYIRRLLWALARLGVIPEGAAHDPWGPELDAREFEEIGRALEAVAGAKAR